MGCDIHLHVEMKFKDSWVAVERKYEFAAERGVIVRSLPWMAERNYRAFAMMADVRNGLDIEPISRPRGLPEDMSGDVEKDSHEWGCDGHSHSWLTLQELINLGDYWDKTVTFKGRVHGMESIKDLIISQEGQKVVLSGPPREYARGIFGPPTEELFDIQFDQSYRDCAGELLDLIPRITEVAEQYGLFDVGDGYAVIGKVEMDHWVDISDRIRIVFWFDN